MWSKFGAHGEHGDVFLFSNIGALWFSENLIRYSLHVCLREVKNNFFSLQTLLFTAFLVTVLKNFNIRTCEHMILNQLRMGAPQAKNAPLITTISIPRFVYSILLENYTMYSIHMYSIHMYEWWVRASLNRDDTFFDRTGQNDTEQRTGKMYLLRLCISLLFGKMYFSTLLVNREMCSSLLGEEM